MLLNLIAQVAGPDGRAGPWIKVESHLVSLRDWLCDALTPMAQRGPRATILADRVRSDLEERGLLPEGEAARDWAVSEEVRNRIRTAGKSNLSRAVSELVSAGLLRRHYQGYRVHHQNRGAQRHAVYTLAGEARLLVSRSDVPIEVPAQGEFILHG